MKIKYNGMELETITEGYWPDGATLIAEDRSSGVVIELREINCLIRGRAFSGARGPTGYYSAWTILPTKPAPRRLTNREALGLCKNCWDCLYDGNVAHSFIYPLIDEDKPAYKWCQKLRAPNSDEWREPTSDLLELTK